MKITIKQYATALLELLKEKNASETKQIIANFTRVLKKNNDLNKEKQIITELEKQLDAHDNIIKIAITATRELQEPEKNALQKTLEAKNNNAKIILSIQTSSSLIGGAILRQGDKILDLSVKKELKSMFNL